MAGRTILGATLSLALIFSPGLAFSVPTKVIKKKHSKSSSRKYKRSSRSTPRRAQMARFYDEREPAARSTGSGVGETAPLMRVIPQRDGRFMLEPLTPKKPGTPVSRPNSRDNRKEATPSSSSQGQYNKFEPWNFSELILAQARHYRGARYSRGASLEYSSATDCSGFVQFIYQGFKIDLPRSSAEQAQVGKVVTRNMDFSKLLPGDLLFFSRGGRHIGHAGIYLGEGRMIHASNYRNGVIITDLRQPYYEGSFVVAKRVFEVDYPQ
jgi:cell wall-associated NlpC family hydrolase